MRNIFKIHTEYGKQEDNQKSEPNISHFYR